MRSSLLLWLSTALLLLACTHDAYEMGESDVSLLQADFVEAHVAADGRVDFVMTDDAELLLLAQPTLIKGVEAGETFCRALLYYYKVNGRAEVESISKLHELTISAASEFVGNLKQDPLNLESVWVDKRYRYLTLGLRLMSGAVDAEDVRHQLDIYCDRIEKDANGRFVYHLRLYHNQGTVPQYYSVRHYMCVPLYNYAADSVSLSVNTYDGVVTKGFRVSP